MLENYARFSEYFWMEKRCNHFRLYISIGFFFGGGVKFSRKNRWVTDDELFDFFPLFRFQWYLFDRYVYVVKIGFKRTKTVTQEKLYWMNVEKCKTFLMIEILSNKKWKKKLGMEYSYASLHSGVFLVLPNTLIQKKNYNRCTGMEYPKSWLCDVID